MNFASGAAADDLQDPMLGWKYGYSMFWILVVTLEVAAVAIFWKLGFVHIKND
jgi:Mg2+ and Co2+ transporter CorA